MSTESQSNNQKKSQRDLEKGALWLKKSKAGADFLSGYVVDESNNRINVVVFKNGYKKPGESSPDYRIYLSENQAPVTADNNSGQLVQKTNQTSNTQEEALDNSEDIPF